MNKRLCLIFLTACMMSGCVTAHLYPVQGPLSQQTPVPILNASITGNLSGTMSVTLPGGEVCEGDWALSATPSTNGAVIQPDPLAPMWDTIYGQGFYTAHILGTNVGQGTLHGNKGTTLSLEFTRVKGVAADSNKNVYKITLQ